MTPILPNQRGFLLCYNTNRARGKYVLDALQVLNEHADKLYRSNGKGCYIEEKRLMNPKNSPIFIESDIDDPTLLADAIFTDLQAGHQIIAVQKAKSFSRFVPVTKKTTLLSAVTDLCFLTQLIKRRTTPKGKMTPIFT